MIPLAKICFWIEPRGIICRPWRRLMERDGQFSYLAVVDFRGERDRMFESVAAAARSRLDGMPLDLAFCTG